MTVNSQRLLLAAAGAGGAAGGALYVDDVFSCFLYEGNDSTQTITNGIDLSGEGGLVWTKPRTTCDSFNDHIFVDSERGNFFLKGNETDANNAIASFNFASTGYTVPNNARVNDGTDQFGNAEKYVSWTFRKAPGFFDVVTWSGDNTVGRQISHNLGSTPGMIWIKIQNSNYAWVVYHRSQGASKYAFLNSDDAFGTASGDNDYFNSTEPTSTHFTVCSSNSTARLNVNDFGSTYVAYVFAHDDQSFGTDSDEAIIKCDGYTGNGTSGHEINLGFEPQWLMIKRASGGSQNWFMFDSMRGIATGGIDGMLRADSAADEQVSNDTVDLTPTGFKIINTNSVANKSGDSYVYMAIRRPHKPPEAGTDVFNTVTYTGDTATGRVITTNILTDTFLLAPRAGDGLQTAHSGYRLHDRLRLAGGQLRPFATTAEITDTNTPTFDLMNGFNLNSYNGTSYNYDEFTYVAHAFRRAPGFFDVVTYSGSSSVQNIPHNLEVEPELMLIKIRGRSFSWEVYNKPSGNTKYMQLNTTNGHIGNPAPHWNQTTPTSTHFTVGTNAGGVNYDGDTHIAYLFASLSGVSKIGSYTGTGSNIGVDCGFTAGARFVLIKRSDSSGDWYVYDSARGIVGGNDPYLLMNTQDAEVTNTDYIDPLNSGFTVTSSAPAALNASGGTYIFLAIA